MAGQNGGSLTACYHATGAVTGADESTGGVAGVNNGTLNACYWGYCTATGSKTVGTGSDAGATQADSTKAWDDAKANMNNALSAAGSVWIFTPVQGLLVLTME